MFDRRRPDPQLGVFETLLVLDGRPVELDAHLARLEASLAELYPDRLPPSLAGRIRARAQEMEQGALRVTVAADGGAELQARTGSRGAFLSHTASKAPRSVALASVTLPGGLGAHKWADRSLLDEAQAHLSEEALPLIVDRDGTVLEASRANLFVVRGDALLTPPTDGRILPGVTRARVLAIASASGLEAHEAALSRDDLLAADEVFLTGSVRGIEPAGSLDGTALAAGGPIALRLADELRRAWAAAARVG